ncbi:arrestin domain-containing protein 3-like [Paramacrobiotus metropolitanus]|uniref:arrestin domain-containing protein 3-like n=1 Tax=Paramacrobiotus metropolitanus TaxID=2943436 RepID=UPI0024459967|nr:arrestin domain-containing protein 3-like [Paramacrobiotus metropolitanus]
MGRIKNLEIILLGDRSVFQRGETVRGKLIIEVEKLLKIRYIRILIRGVARVHWTESRNNGARLGGYGMLYTEHFTAEVEYVNKKLLLLGSENGESRETLAEGRHEYRFTFALPNSAIATSFEGKYGSIRYWLKAELGKPWAFAYKTKKPFTVISPIDINRTEFGTPSEAALEKMICCLWCVSAPVQAEIRTDRRGYCPGESIAISALFTNGTRRNITPHATLYQIQSFTANGKSRSRAIKLTTVSGVSIPAGETGYWDAQLLKVPAVSPSILNCQLIKVDYQVKITLQVPGACNIYADLPVVIGTVPCRRRRPPLPSLSVVMPGATSDTLHLRPPGPPAYLEMEEELPYEAPPTYAECIGGPVNILDDEDDEAQMFGCTSFTPMYTYVYDHPTGYAPPPPYSTSAVDATAVEVAVRPAPEDGAASGDCQDDPGGEVHRRSVFSQSARGSRTGSRHSTRSTRSTPATRRHKTEEDGETRAPLQDNEELAEMMMMAAGRSQLLVHGLPFPASDSEEEQDAEKDRAPDEEGEGIPAHTSADAPASPPATGPPLTRSIRLPSAGRRPLP